MGTGRIITTIVLCSGGWIAIAFSDEPSRRLFVFPVSKVWMHTVVNFALSINDSNPQFT